jgi:shikimate dehydrogenase
MRKVCVIGWPVAHSRSPLIHNHWIEKFHVPEARYEIRPIEEGKDLRRFLRNLRENGYIGANVTIPHKRRAYSFIKKHGQLHGDAEAFGAVNTIWLNDTDQLCGTNTDGIGFLKHLELSTGWSPGSTDVVTVLGAGGAARAVVAVLWLKGCQINLVNRSFDNALNLKNEIGEIPSPRAPSINLVPWEEKEDLLGGCKLLVNTTSLGMKNHGELRIDIGLLPKTAIVYDLVYEPLETKLLKDAHQRNLQTVDGLGMLIHQAIPGFRLWFGEYAKDIPDTSFDTEELHKKLLHDLGEI